MLVFGDRLELADPQERLGHIAGQLTSLAAMHAGIDRHSRLVSALIDAGQLLQGAADEGFPDEQPLSALVHRLADCVVRSWGSDFKEMGELPSVPPIETAGQVELRVPEGFAFYAVYPEAYIEAARRLELSGPPRVIGIRSIGTTLGAIVAATLAAPPAITVRPFGDPFERQVELPDEVLDAAAHYVIVDEGPGLSGSSFNAVADWLESRGIPLQRIAFVPSHGGDPGPQASEAHLDRWKRAQRVPAEFGDRLSDLLRTWAGEKLGPADGLRFAGLGAIGERKLEMARALHAAGLTLEPIGLVHGFLIERRGAAGQIATGEKPIPKIARYILARAALFPADESSGASLEKLMEMCRRNISLALGDWAVVALDGFNLEHPSAALTRVCTDNRMDRDNWLRTTDGRIVKTDALDHHQGHNLIGCQDAAWDVAGAIAELDLDESESETLIQLLEQGGRAIHRDLLAFYHIAYAAFRLGEATLAGRPDRGRYVNAVRNILDQHVCSATPRESSVG
jgi:hypothetical protein